MAPIDPTIKPRKHGRPKRADAPVVPWDEVDRLLVFGEPAQDPRNGQEGIRYPSLADLAKRYAVSRNLMWRYAHKANCFARREEARRKTLESYERKVIEKTAKTRANATTEVSQIVDRYVVDFHQALRDGKVQANSALDLDRLVRLKELLNGNADTRSELTGELTLEAIQGRHRRMRDHVDAAVVEIAGVVEQGTPGAATAEERGQLERQARAIAGVAGHENTPEGSAAEEARERERLVRAGLEALAPEIDGAAALDDTAPAAVAKESAHGAAD